MPAMKDPTLPQCVVNCAAYGRDGTRRDIGIDAISDVLAVDDGSFVWVGLYEPDEGILAKLQEEFGLHDLAVEDARNAHQRPKLEAYGNSLFVVVHTAQSVDSHIRFGETHVFVGPRYLVTVRHGASTSYAPARARFEREAPELEHPGPGAALYMVLDLIVDNFLPIVQEFSQDLNELEQDVFAEEFRRDTVRQLYDLKRELTRLRMAVTPLQDILGQLARPRGGLIDEESRLYFRDVLDHVVRINETTDTLREMLTAAMSVNLSLVTIHQGEVVKRLAGWAALLAAPTLIASWYGMNFEHMPELHGRYAYPVMIGATALVCAVLYGFLRRAKWL
ncbi:magnesium/cobalt transporter CorA [Vulcaniibacterium tengchongense]|uniref:Magnesium transport protein CorA n=1 Tax=Vulcaniibacterium tengchongense TaxID=1273429 RepID=A0A3N4VDI9_9GAMM|nr:magnesium/cobalt transporter CorA [Vulcaniibacterium tengchongense]RPE81072.1 magnesium transporter [Vulcaniibacterium tengchongense]